MKIIEAMYIRQCTDILDGVLRVGDDHASKYTVIPEKKICYMFRNENCQSFMKNVLLKVWLNATTDIFVISCQTVDICIQWELMRS